MKKTYRITIDYEIEINERVKAPEDEEYSQELLEKMQDIMNALFQCPDVLHEYIKERFYWGFLNCDAFRNDLGELIGVKDSEELLSSSLVKHLPSETVPYLLGFTCIDKDFPGTNKEEEDMRWLLICQLESVIPLNASIEEIGDINGLTLLKR